MWNVSRMHGSQHWIPLYIRDVNELRTKWDI